MFKLQHSPDNEVEFNGRSVHPVATLICEAAISGCDASKIQIIVNDHCYVVIMCHATAVAPFHEGKYFQLSHLNKDVMRVLRKLPSSPDEAIDIIRRLKELPDENGNVG